MSDKTGLAIGGGVVAILIVFGPLLTLPFWWPLIPLGILFGLNMVVLLLSIFEWIDKSHDIH